MPTSSSTTPTSHAPTTATIPSPSTTPSIPTTDPILPPTLTPQELPAPATLPLRPLFLSLLLACPILAALPPRKLDLYTLMLGGTWVLSAEEVLRGQRYGWRLHSTSRSESSDNDGEEEGGEDNARRLREETRIVNGRKGEQEGGVKAMARRLWMGSETEGWKERRAREEREALAEGKGYRELIGDRIEEAFVEVRGRRGEEEE